MTQARVCQQRIGALIVMIVLGCFATWRTPNAATMEKKLFQAGGPETRTRCVQEAKTKGLPACSVQGFSVTCHDTWMTACVGWATDFMQHEVFLVASGPDAPNDALKAVLDSALEHSLAVATATGIGTPGELGTKAAAAFAAFKVALATSLSGQPALAALKDQYSLSLRTTSEW